MEIRSYGKVNWHRRKALTLIELLIVVVVLGILAAIVLPQFLDSSEDAQLAQLLTDLRSIRMAIARYTIDHDGRTPNLDPDGVERNTSVGLVNRLTQRSNKAGALRAAGEYGPYLTAFPSNPFREDPTFARKVRFGTENLPAGGSGWYFNTDTYRFSANTAGHVDF